MGMFSESVDVLCNAAGQPVALQWAGWHYAVCAEPVRWFERRQWWAEESRAPLGSGPGLVDHEVWRVQVRADPPRPDPGQPGRPENSHVPEEPLTLDISRHLGSGRWRLVRIHDALKPRTA
jgi:hypothetical protein